MKAKKQQLFDLWHNKKVRNTSYIKFDPSNVQRISDFDFFVATVLFQDLNEL